MREGRRARREGLGVERGHDDAPVLRADAAAPGPLTRSERRVEPAEQAPELPDAVGEALPARGGEPELGAGLAPGAGPRPFRDEVGLGVGIPPRRLGVDVAGAEPVAERGERRELLPVAVDRPVHLPPLEHERPPPLLDEPHRNVRRQLPPPLPVHPAEHVDRLHDGVVRSV